MPRKLTVAQEQFAQLVASGLTQSDSYRQTFPNSLKWKKEVVHVKASELAGKVAVRINELRQSVASKRIMERAEALAYLTEAVRKPISDIDATSPLCQEQTVTAGQGWESTKYKSVSKLHAMERLAKMQGWDEPEKHEHQVRIIIGGNADD